jgi:hypothetical protein
MFITLPVNTKIPVEISLFSPVENLIMILIGMHAVSTMKEKYVSQEYSDIVSEYEIQLCQKTDENKIIRNVYDEFMAMEKIKYDTRLQEQIHIESERLCMTYRDNISKCNQENLDYRDKIDRLNENILCFEKELIKKEEFIRHSNIVNELRIENEVNLKIKQKEDDLKMELEKYKELLNISEKTAIKNENNSKIMINEQIQSLQGNLNIALMEREQEKNLRLSGSIDEISLLLKNQSQSQNKSNVRGAIGENYFRNLALNTFCDCTNFEIVEKAKTPHCGDFWLKFEKFTIMVDSKNYIDTPVPLRDRIKLKQDIAFNKNIKIAWLVSMDQPILTYSSYPFMIDVEDGVCYCYINSLMKSDNPGNLLRMAWYSCNFVYNNLLNIDNEINLLSKYQKNEGRIKNILNKMLIQSKERFTLINQLTENGKITDSDIRDCLNEEIRDVRENHIELVSKWFSDNVIRKEGSKLKSSDIHKKFITDDDNRIHGIDGDMFKQIIRSIKDINENDIIRGKTDKAQYIINGYKMI